MFFYNIYMLKRIQNGVYYWAELKFMLTNQDAAPQQVIEGRG